MEIVTIIALILTVIAILSINLYCMHCKNLIELKRIVDRGEEPTFDDIVFPQFSIFLIFYVFTFIPRKKIYPKYYEFEVFNDVVKTIRSYRKFIVWCMLLILTLIIANLLYLKSL
jgi:hypothetical protein